MLMLTKFMAPMTWPGTAHHLTAPILGEAKRRSVPYARRIRAHFRMGPMRSALTLLLIPALALGTLGAIPPAAAADLSGTATIAAVLAQLPVVAPVTSGYDRSLFVHWIDADGNGCDTRQEVLIQESTTPVVKGSGCTIISGTWVSWYDNATWTAPSDVDIDHLVPLGEAWASGANTWTADQRRAYANDLGVSYALEAVTDNVNQAKGDKDPAAWMPPQAAVACRYVTDWILVKYRWNLSIDSTEQTALDNVVSGACGTTVVTVPAKGGTSAANPTVQRISGVDRYSTAVAISNEYPSGVPVVYIATGSNYPDALSAAPAAASQGGPLLLTDPSALPSSVHTELVRLAPALIVVVGGTSAIADSVYQELSTLAPAIRRDSGTDRFGTSRIINQRAFPTASKAYFATGSNFPDALSASAAAGGSHSPVVLVDGSAASIDTATQNLIGALGVTSAVIAGGTAVVSPQIESSLTSILGSGSVVRLAGGDRYQTSSAINRGSFSSAPTVYFAVGTGFADALAGAALAGRDGAALYVTPSSCVYSYVINDLQALGTTKRVLLGGMNALGQGVENLTSCDSLVPPPVIQPPVTPPSAPANPGDTKNCSDFSTWQAAQDWFNLYYPYYGDVARLDQNNDLIVCETLPGHP